MVEDLTHTEGQPTFLATLEDEHEVAEEEEITDDEEVEADTAESSSHETDDHDIHRMTAHAERPTDRPE